MAYIETSKVKTIRETIKKAFPQYKFSVRTEHHSSVYVTILSGPMAFKCDHTQLNTYYLNELEDSNLRDLALKIEKIIRTIAPVTYHETGDYGNQPDYYMHIHLGSWCKPYEVKGKAAA